MMWRSWSGHKLTLMKVEVQLRGRLIISNTNYSDGAKMSSEISISSLKKINHVYNSWRIKIPSTKMLLTSKPSGRK